MRRWDWHLSELGTEAEAPPTLALLPCSVHTKFLDESFSQYIVKLLQANKMVHVGKALAATSEDLGLIPRIHMVERQNQLPRPQKLSSDSFYMSQHIYVDRQKDTNARVHVHTCVHTCTHTQHKCSYFKAVIKTRKVSI